MKGCLWGECDRKGVEDSGSSWGNSKRDIVTPEERLDRLELLRFFHVLVTLAINHADFNFAFMVDYFNIAITDFVWGV